MNTAIRTHLPSSFLHAIRGVSRAVGPSEWYVLSGTVLIVLLSALTATAANRPSIQGIRTFSSADATRVVISLSGPIAYELIAEPSVTSSTSPSRLLIRFSSAQIAPGIRASAKVDDGLLKEVRTGLISDSVVRVSLEVERLGAYHATAFRSPDQIVIQLRKRQERRRPTRLSISSRPPITSLKAPVDRQTVLTSPLPTPSPSSLAPAKLSEKPQPQKEIASQPPTRSPAEEVPAQKQKLQSVPDVQGSPPFGARPQAATRNPGETTLDSRSQRDWDRLRGNDGPRDAVGLSLHSEHPARLETRTVTLPSNSQPTSKDTDSPSPSSLPLTSLPIEPADRQAALTPPPLTPPPPAPQIKEQPAETAIPFPRYRIMLDPGHGGSDPGAQSADGLQEKNVVLAVSKRLAQKLRTRLGVDVLLTRTQDVFIPLPERTAKANAAKADLFVSIHANASPNTEAHGIETYYLNNTHDRATIRLAKLENGIRAKQQLPQRGDSLSYILSDLIQTGKEEESIALAQALQTALVDQVRTVVPLANDLGVKKGPFYVLVGAHMPCVLAELAFLTHADEGRRLGSAHYQETLAEGLFNGIADFLRTGISAEDL